MNTQIIKTDGKDLVVIPLDEYNKMIELIEDIEDIRAIKEYQENPSEGIPHDVIKRIYVDEENPLKVFREYRQLTISQLAKKADVSTSYISNIESGQRKGSYQYLLRLAKALDLNVDDIVAEK